MSNKGKSLIAVATFFLSFPLVGCELCGRRALAGGPDAIGKVTMEEPARRGSQPKWLPPGSRYRHELAARVGCSCPVAPALYPATVRIDSAKLGVHIRGASVSTQTSEAFFGSLRAGAYTTTMVLAMMLVVNDGPSTGWRVVAVYPAILSVVSTRRSGTSRSRSASLTGSTSAKDLWFRLAAPVDSSQVTSPSGRH